MIKVFADASKIHAAAITILLVLLKICAGRNRNLAIKSAWP